MQSSRQAVSLVLLAALAGCSLGAPTGPRASAAGRRPVGASASPAAGGVAYAPLVESHRAITATADLVGKAKLVAVALTGKAKLISDAGAGILSNNSGGILSNNAGSLIANNGGGLTGKVKYALAQAPEENLLADARIEVLDGAGQVLVGADDAPIGATSDETGAFTFTGELPDENLVLRIRLYNGGQLSAILPRGGGKRAIDLDTASSLGAAYVMETFVRKQAAVFAKLPEAEATALRGELEAARGFLPASAKSYKVQDLVAATAAIGAKAAPVASRLERIKALLIAGQANLGEGRPATEVTLSAPGGVLGMPDGTLLVAETGAGRIRRITAAGRIAQFLGNGYFSNGTTAVPTAGGHIETPATMLPLADGAVALADHLGNRIFKLTMDGKLTPLLGTGRHEQDPATGRGTDVSIREPRSLAQGPDGSLYVGEVPKATTAGRLLRLKPDGTVEELAGPPGTDWERAEIAAIAVAPDGTLYVGEERWAKLWKRTPAGAWSVFDAAPGLGEFAALALTPDGALIATAGAAQRIYRYAPDGTRSVLAGTGEAGFGGDGGPATAARLNGPAGLWLAPDGRIVFTEVGNCLVREIAADGTIRTIGGTTSESQVGAATGIAINSPSGFTFDPDGKLVIAEGAGDSIKRLDGGTLTRIAGAGHGYAGDGGPAIAARFSTITAIAYAGRDLYVLDGGNALLRKIDAAGTITAVAGVPPGGPGGFLSARMPARERPMGLPLGLAIGPDGLPYWTDNETNQVCRLKDGFVEIVAGDVDGGSGDAGDEGAPALGAKLSSPLGLAFDHKGDLYVADAGNLKIRRISGLAAGAPVLSTAAGSGLPGALGFLGGAKPDDEGKAAREAVLIGPISVAFNAADELFIGEAGSLKLQSLAGMGNLALGELPLVTARIRRVGADGKVTTVAGPGTRFFGDPASDDSIVMPLGIGFDPGGRFVLVDTGNNQVKVLPAGSF